MTALPTRRLSQRSPERTAPSTIITQVDGSGTEGVTALVMLVNSTPTVGPDSLAKVRRLMKKPGVSLKSADVIGQRSCQAADRFHR